MASSPLPTELGRIKLFPKSNPPLATLYLRRILQLIVHSTAYRTNPRSYDNKWAEYRTHVK